jgi:hypothetical protein
VVVKILKYEFSNFWWGFKVARILAWPGYLPITLYGRLVAILITRALLIITPPKRSAVPFYA